MKVSEKTVTLKNGQNYLLKSASPSDAENILTHLRITHAESYQNLNSSAKHWESVSVSDEEKFLTDFEQSPSKFMLVAFHDEKIVGGLGFFGEPGEFVKTTANIGMSVQNAHSGLGLGTELIHYAMEKAKESKFHRVGLTVRTYNEGGIKLYEKCGFNRIGTLKANAFIDGKYVDEYAYELLFLG